MVYGGVGRTVGAPRGTGPGPLLQYFPTVTPLYTSRVLTVHQPGPHCTPAGSFSGSFSGHLRAILRQNTAILRQNTAILRQNTAILRQNSVKFSKFHEIRGFPRVPDAGVHVVARPLSLARAFPHFGLKTTKIPLFSSKVQQCHTPILPRGFSAF